MVKPLVVAAALALSAGAFAQAQPQVGLPAALEVFRLAPQLLQFAGSQANFQSLVNGLSLGQPIALSTVGADGTVQTVTFTPTTGPMTALEIARTLEAARQQLIANGIAAPTAQQLGSVLVGGTLPTALGGTPVNGVLPQTSPAAQIQTTLTPAAPAVNTSDSARARNTSDTPALGPQATPPPVTGPAAPITTVPVAPAVPAAGGTAPAPPVLGRRR